MYISIYMLPFQTEMEAQAISLNLFAHPANRSHPFENGLNGLNRLNGHACLLARDMGDGQRSAPKAL
jgi:hypothetical protein